MLFRSYRNALRYPLDVHHGMPLIAVGAETPAEKRSIYATHPAGLVWIVAGSFTTLGEQEYTARLTAIVASLIALACLYEIVRRWLGRPAALLCGFIYLLIPMNVFFGRMVNHEPFCTAAMLLAILLRQSLTDAKLTLSRRYLTAVAMAVVVLVCAAVDWPGFLFAGLLGVDLLIAWRRKRVTGGICATAVATMAGLLFLVILHIVYGGLDGSWKTLWAIFTSRSGAAEAAITGSAWHHTVDNVTMVTLILATAGLICVLACRVFQGAKITLPQGGWAYLATGALWLIVFWRQYRVHHYWLYYLGPCVALLAAVAVMQVRELGARFGRVVANGSLIICLLLPIFASQRQCDAFFASVQIPPEFVEMWKHLRETTPDGVRVKLPWDPIREETFGDYTFRNITPPQFAWYVDRPFEVVPAPAGASAPPSRQD